MPLHIADGKSRLPREQSNKVFDAVLTFGAHNYNSLPVALVKGKGVHVWDADGNQFYDFLGGYAALNQGHCHPRIVRVLQEQAERLTLTSRAFFTDGFAEYAQLVHQMFGYDKVLPMNSGVEACETACKIARKWGYTKKGIPDNEAKIICAEGNYWGRTMAAISASTDPTARDKYGPWMPGFLLVPYDNLKALEKMLEAEPNVCAVMLEPIQGEAGIVVPSDGYLKGVRDLCTKYNVLWINDEVQAGLGRTGKLLCVYHEKVRPDIITLGKALSGGMLPFSSVLADDEIILCMLPGDHGSTYGGNPLACRVACEALKVILDENLTENAQRLGQILQSELEKRLDKSVVKCVRGKGLLRAIGIQDGLSFGSTDVCVKLRDNGILCKSTHNQIIRMAPPLVITEEQLRECIEIIVATVNSFASK